jgi:hypothetical protein
MSEYEFVTKEEIERLDAEIKKLKGDCDFLLELINESALGKELAKERENAKALVEALKRYGDHEPKCPLFDGSDERCDCGFVEAYLKAVGK